MARYRLLATCWIDGQLKRGGIIERPDDWQGPRRSTRTHTQGMAAGTAYKDELLFVRVDDAPPPSSEH
jgi:hypothetical protein